MEDQFDNQEDKGQSLVIFAVIMVVLVALAALAIDGGFSLAKRREAQNAADSGALAGAAILCEGGTQDEARAQAIDYAARNGAAYPAPVIGFDQRGITVKATIPHETFLAGIFGINVVNPSASATAGCYVPCNIQGVLPVAWMCQEPPDDPDYNSCGVRYPVEGQPDPIYVIMDSVKSGPDMCSAPYPIDEVGKLDCDLDNDGVNELMTGSDALGGNRSWLDIDGGGSNEQELVDFVMGRRTADVRGHTWFGGKTGNIDRVYQIVRDNLVGTIVFLPVFNELPCQTPIDINCPGAYHTNPPDEWQDQVVLSTGASTNYFHVITFSAFKVTCVSAQPSETCPGKTAAITLNPSIPTNTNTIEGHFVQYDAGNGACTGLDAGLHTIYLNR